MPGYGDTFTRRLVQKHGGPQNDVGPRKTFHHVQDLRLPGQVQNPAITQLMWRKNLFDALPRPFKQLLQLVSKFFQGCLRKKLVEEEVTVMLKPLMNFVGV